MSTVDEKKTFVIKHVFTDINKKRNTKNTTIYGKKETHFNVPWSIFLYSTDYSSAMGAHLQCHKFKGSKEWSIDTTVITKVFCQDGKKESTKNVTFSSSDSKSFEHINTLQPSNDYLVDGNLTVEFHVTINKMTGVRIFKSFDDESAKELSDIVLKVKDQKFYVLKNYLAVHSTYFKSLFLGNFNESKQSKDFKSISYEVELKDIDPCDFQKFLEVVYSHPDINEKSVKGILKLADMYDAKAVIQQCEKFLVDNSKLDYKEKFLLAIQYKLENLKKKCMPEFKTLEDIASVIPEDPTQMDHVVWKELLNYSIDLRKKK